MGTSIVAVAVVASQQVHLTQVLLWHIRLVNLKLFRKRDASCRRHRRRRSRPQQKVDVYTNKIEILNQRFT